MDKPSGVYTARVRTKDGGYTYMLQPKLFKITGLSVLGNIVTKVTRSVSKEFIESHNMSYGFITIFKIEEQSDETVKLL